MNCREVKQLLYQYIENDLDKDTAVSIKKHVSSCKECAAELASAKKYKQEVSSLNVTSAPADFLRKLNLRIDSEVNKKSFFSRTIDTLFFPLKVKLPVGAAGLLAAILMIVIFFNPTEKFEKSVFVQAEKEYAKKAGKAGAGVQIAKTEHMPKEAEKDMIASNADKRAQAPAARTESGRDLIAQADVYEIAIVIQDPLSPQQTMPAESVSRAASGAMVEEKEAFKGTDDSLKIVQKGALDSAIALKSQQSITQEELKKEKADEGVQDKQLAAKKAYQTKAKVLKDARALQSQSINVQDSISEIKKIALSMKGKVIGQELNKKDKSNLIIVEIPASNQQLFIDRLNRVGSVKSGEQRARIQRSSNVQYNINVMQSQ